MERGTSTAPGFDPRATWNSPTVLKTFQLSRSIHHGSKSRYLRFWPLKATPDRNYQQKRHRFLPFIWKAVTDRRSRSRAPRTACFSTNGDKTRTFDGTWARNFRIKT